MFFMYVGGVGLGVAIPMAYDAASRASEYYRHTRMMHNLKELDEKIKSEIEPLLVQADESKAELENALAKQKVTELELRAVREQNSEFGAKLEKAESANHKAKLMHIAAIR